MGEASPRDGDAVRRLRPGRLLSVEGIDGSGKSTQVRALAEWLTAEGREVRCVREPGETELGMDLRELLLHRRYEADLDPWAEALLLVAARAQLLAEVVVPALRRGAVVVCDRFVDSTLAYQGSGRGLGMAQLRQLHAASCGNLWPDLTILLELPVGVATGRLQASRLPLDRMESGGDGFLGAVARGFGEIAAAEPARVVTVDATLAAEQVTAAIRALVGARLGAVRA